MDPRYPHPIVCRASGDFYRALYAWTEPGTLHIRDIKVNLTFPLGYVGLINPAMVYKGCGQGPCSDVGTAPKTRNGMP